MPPVELIITDVTRMGGDKTCIAGVTHQGQTVRPLLPPPGLTFRGLCIRNQIIRPSAVLKLLLRAKQRLEPPHLEDHLWLAPEKAEFLRVANESTWERVLNRTASPSVVDIFGRPLYRNRQLRPGEGTRSLGTIKGRVIAFHCGAKHQDPNRVVYRMDFSDGSNTAYFNIPITDLTLTSYANSLREAEGLAGEEVEARMKALLKKSKVYIRLGLTRPFRTSTVDDAWCYLQVTGVYPFPYFADGEWVNQTFGQLASSRLE